MTNFPPMPFTRVYVIYHADVLSEYTSDIERMSPERHMPAGYRANSPQARLRRAVAARFTLTEGDEQYDFGYLGAEHRPPRIRYFPYGTISADGELPDDDYEGETGTGQHRKWVADLTAYEWRIFADSYLIDLDDAGYPVDYEETMGAITEHGHLEAISVDNREGWSDFGGDPVLDSNMYVSFAYPEDPNV